MKNHIPTVLSVCACIGLSLTAGYKINADRNEELDRQRENARYELYESLYAEFMEADTVEYGSSFDMDQVLVSWNGDPEVSGMVNPSEVGSYVLTCKVSGTEERFLQYEEREFKKEIHVIDTKAPQITIQYIEWWVEAGTEDDITANVLSVTDPVDGDLEYNAEGGRGTWRLIGEPDYNTPGTYEIRVLAEDKNGNQNDTSFNVLVYEPYVADEPLYADSYAYTAADTSGNYQIIWNYLTNVIGFNTAGAAGVAGNIYQESNFDPNCGGGYYGLCQWGGYRITALQDYCTANGLDYHTCEGQLAFMFYELQTSYPSCLNSLYAVEDSIEGARSAGWIIAHEYERSVWTDRIYAYAEAFYLENSPSAEPTEE